MGSAEGDVMRKGSTVILDAVSVLHERGLQGVRVRANFYATGHWRCRVYVSRPGGDPAVETDQLLAYTSGRGEDLVGDGRRDWTADTLADALAARATPFAHAERLDPAYAAWYRRLRQATGADGVFALWDEDDDWEGQGRLAVIRVYGDERAEPDFVPLPPAP
jgi:hypothetical protein